MDAMKPTKAAPTPPTRKGRIFLAGDGAASPPLPRPTRGKAA